MEKLFDSELKVMEILWQNGATTAKEIAVVLNEDIGWSRTTTYTVIKKCIDKGVVERSGTKFLCRALVTKDEVREQETDELVGKMFDGSSDLLVASLLRSKKINSKQFEQLRQLAKEMDEQ